MTHGSGDGTQSALQRMMQLTNSFRTTQLVYVAAELGNADVLHEGPKRSEDVAKAVGAQAQALQRVMRGLVLIGVLSEDDGRFSLTPLDGVLRSAAQPSGRWPAIDLGGLYYRTWSGLLHTVRTGETAFDHIFGMPIYQYWRQHPDEEARLQTAIARGTAGLAARVLAASRLLPLPEGRRRGRMSTGRRRRRSIHTPVTGPITTRVTYSAARSPAISPGVAWSVSAAVSARARLPTCEPSSDTVSPTKTVTTSRWRQRLRGASGALEVPDVPAGE